MGGSRRNRNLSFSRRRQRRLGYTLLLRDDRPLDRSQCIRWFLGRDDPLNCRRLPDNTRYDRGVSLRNNDLRRMYVLLVSSVLCSRQLPLQFQQLAVQGVSLLAVILENFVEFQPKPSLSPEKNGDGDRNGYKKANAQ